MGRHHPTGAGSWVRRRSRDAARTRHL